MIHVVGGTYWETCHFPHWRQCFGSGGRAAAVLSGLSDAVVLHTYCGETGRRDREALAACFSLELGNVVAAEEVAFEYLHPLAPKSVQPSRKEIGSTALLKVEAPTVLRFGCWEADPLVHAETVVYDPQSPEAPLRYDANGSTANRLAIVCNKAEGGLLTGESDPKEIGRVLIKDHCAEVAIIKLGPCGALVCSSEAATAIPAYATERVFPIGSGDVFSAVFTHYWAEKALDPRLAADLASRASAWYCATQTFPRGEGWLEDSPIEWRPLPKYPTIVPARVYLAGPFFTIQQLWVVEEALSAIEAMGVSVFSPYHDVGSSTSACEIASKDLDGLRTCQAVLAIIDGWDPGTLFEVGYARALGIPVIALVQKRNGTDLKMLEGTSVSLERDLASAVYKTVWAAISAA